MSEREDWWNDLATMDAEGRVGPTARPLWAVWRAWNSLRPDTLPWRVLYLAGSLAEFTFALYAPWEKPGAGRVEAIGVLALAVVMFCLALGRSRVTVRARGPRTALAIARRREVKRRRALRRKWIVLTLLVIVVWGAVAAFAH